jgi:preprotein translocase subunit Sss1
MLGYLPPNKKDLSSEEFQEFQESLRRQAAACRKPEWLELKRATKGAVNAASS